jgi:hypothetical protein
MLHGGSALVPNLSGAEAAPEQFGDAILEDSLASMGMSEVELQ